MRRLARWGLIYTMPDTNSNACKRQCWPSGSEALPEGIVAKTSNLEMRPLWDSGINNRISKRPLNLLAIAVGVTQKEFVNKIVEKVIVASLVQFDFDLKLILYLLTHIADGSSDFVVMLFHYDGFVDGWKNLAWSNHAIHVSAINQTKWYNKLMCEFVFTNYSQLF